MRLGLRPAVASTAADITSFRFNRMTTSSTSPACPQCGIHPRATNRRGEIEALCEGCERERVAGIYRVFAHHQQHPGECCCDTYLGRACCESPVHGGWWQVRAIADGERFSFLIRAANRAEAMAVGTVACRDNGEECLGVRRVGAPGPRPRAG